MLMSTAPVPASNSPGVSTLSHFYVLIELWNAGRLGLTRPVNWLNVNICDVKSWSTRLVDPAGRSQLALALAIASL